MRKNRHPKQEHDNLDRWLVSYADFMTLLFAFFVVMYAISSVNEGKYRILSDSLSENFEVRPSSESVIDFRNEISNSIVEKSENFVELPIPTLQKDEIDLQEKNTNPTLSEISNEVSNAVTDLMDKGLISINQDENWLEIEIKSSILFNSGGARLSEDAEDILAKLAKIIRVYPNQLQIEGYTDNIPINTRQFPSNWELSSSRAASVVHLFEEEGVDPTKMQAIGFGEYKPKFSNQSAQGRVNNRRVVLVVLGSDNTRKVSQLKSKNIKKLKDADNYPDEYKPEADPQALIDL